MRAQTAPLAVTLVLLMLAGCGKADQPSSSDSVAAPLAKTAPSAAPSQRELKQPSWNSVRRTRRWSCPERWPTERPLFEDLLSVAGPGRRGAGASRDRVKAGDVLLIVDSPDIAQAYSEYVKEDSELQYATRAQDLAKDLYENKAMPLKDLKQAENELVKARAEFRRAKERLLSLRVPADELTKPLDKQKITSRFEMKSPLTGIVVERAVTRGSRWEEIPHKSCLPWRTWTCCKYSPTYMSAIWPL